MGHFSIKILPGYPDTPQTVEITASGLDDTRVLQFTVNDTIEYSEAVPQGGVYSKSVPVKPGKMRNALAAFNGFFMDFDTFPPSAGAVLDTGDYFSIRYQP